MIINLLVWPLGQCKPSYSLIKDLHAKRLFNRKPFMAMIPRFYFHKLNYCSKPNVLVLLNKVYRSHRTKLPSKLDLLQLLFRHFFTLFSFLKSRLSFVSLWRQVSDAWNVVRVKVSHTSRWLVTLKTQTGSVPFQNGFHRKQFSTSGRSEALLLPSRIDHHLKSTIGLWYHEMSPGLASFNLKENIYILKSLLIICMTKNS